MWRGGVQRVQKIFRVPALVLGNPASIKIYKGSTPLIKSSVYSKTSHSSDHNLERL